MYVYMYVCIFYTYICLVIFSGSIQTVDAHFCIVITNYDVTGGRGGGVRHYLIRINFMLGTFH